MLPYLPSLRLLRRTEAAARHPYGHSPQPIWWASVRPRMLGKKVNNLSPHHHKRIYSSTSTFIQLQIIHQKTALIENEKYQILYSKDTLAQLFLKIATVHYFFLISFQYYHKLTRGRISDIQVGIQQMTIIRNRNSKKVETTYLGSNKDQTIKTYWDRRTVCKLKHGRKVHQVLAHKSSA